MPLFTFPSIEAYAAGCVSVAHSGDASWAGCSWDHAQKTCMVGDPALVEDAKRMLDEFHSVELPETRVNVRFSDVWGASLNTGAWIAGEPNAFRRRRRSPSDVGPLRVVVSTTCSASVSAADMRRRGTAILAFLERVQMFRPVTLSLLAETSNGSGGWRYQIIDVQTPLNLSVASFAIAHPGFARQLTYNRVRQECGSWDGRWPSDYGRGGYAQRRRERLGLADDDMVIPEAYAADALIVDPVRWVRERLEFLTEGSN